MYSIVQYCTQYLDVGFSILCCILFIIIQKLGPEADTISDECCQLRQSPPQLSTETRPCTNIEFVSERRDRHIDLKESTEATDVVCESNRLADDRDSSVCESLPSICFFKPCDPTELLADCKRHPPVSEPEPEPEHSSSETCSPSTPRCTNASNGQDSNDCTHASRLSSYSRASSSVSSVSPSPRLHSTPIFPELVHSPSNTEVEAQHSSIRTAAPPIGAPVLAASATTLSSFRLVSTSTLAVGCEVGQMAVLDEHIARLGQFCAVLDADADEPQQPSASSSSQSCVSVQFSIATQLGMCCTNSPAFNSAIARRRAPHVPRGPVSVHVHSALEEPASSSILSTSTSTSADLLLLRQQFVGSIYPPAGFAPTQSSTLSRRGSTACGCSCCWSNDVDPNTSNSNTNASYEMNQLAIKYLPDSELSRIATSMEASRPTRTPSTRGYLQQHSRVLSHLSSASASDAATAANYYTSPSRTNSEVCRREQQQQHQYTLIRQCGLQQESTLNRSSGTTIDFPSDVSLFGLNTTELSLCTVGYLQRYGLLPSVSRSPARRIQPSD